MNWIERLVLGGAVGLGLVLLVAGLRQNAEDMEAAPVSAEGIPVGVGAPWDPDRAVRSPQHCTTSEQRMGVTWVSPAGERTWKRWPSAPIEQALPSAVPFAETWSALRIRFCRHASLELSRADAEGLVIGARSAAAGRRIRVGLYDVDGRLPGTPYRIELLARRSADPAGPAEEESSE